MHDQTWETFSRNWEVNVKHAFQFAREALVAPLAAGSLVVSLSSGAARMGSPMSGGYAGAKATTSFISAYAGAESERRALGIRFVALLPKLTPATGLGSTFVDAYAEYAGVSRDAYLEQFGPTLIAEQVATCVLDLAVAGDGLAEAYVLTAAGLTVLA